MGRLGCGFAGLLRSGLGRGCAAPARHLFEWALGDGQWRARATQSIAAGLRVPRAWWIVVRVGRRKLLVSFRLWLGVVARASGAHKNFKLAHELVSERSIDLADKIEFRDQIGAH